MSKKAIYPGTFDPVTFGHIDIIKSARLIFPEVVVAVAHNPEKNPFFSVKERVEMLTKATASMDGVTVCEFKGLVVNFARQENARVLIRGLRMLSDFEYEFMMALTNRKFAPDVETIFLMPQESYSYISSKLLREAAFLGADISPFLPDFVERALKAKIKKS